MTTKATYTPARKSVKDAAAAAAAAPVRRERKTIDPHQAGAGVIAGNTNERTEPEDEEQVRVKVHKAFSLTDDWHVVHHYALGEQDMPKSHSEHFYAQANGVEIL